MKIIHLYSDWRWTGPAEPVTILCKGLQDRGYDVVLACCTPPLDHPQNLEKKAKERGVNVYTGFQLNRYFNIRENLKDIVNITKYLKKEKIDILHVHMSHDHFLGAISVSRSKGNTKLVKTNHKGEPLQHKLWNKIFLSRYTHHLIINSKGAFLHDKVNFDLPKDSVSLVYGTVDTSRFYPKQKNIETCKSLGINPEEPVLGIVARMQRRRRFPQLLNGFKLAIKKYPSLKLLIVGRGTHAYEVKDLARELGLENNVLFPGYRDDDYLDVLTCFDAKIYLVPGSDGSCRAVMEAMAMGKPAIVADRGVLPELVEDGVCGFVIKDDTPEKIAEAIIMMFDDEVMRLRMGNAARARILDKFNMNRYIDEVESIYIKLIS